MSESLARQLHQAVENGEVDRVRSLLQQGLGADPNHQLYWSKEWRYELPPLHQACRDGNLEIVKVLHVGGADPHKGYGKYNMTPLYEACSEGNKEVVEYLIREAGCGVDVRDKYGETPLHRACVNGHTEIVRFLVEECRCAVDVRNNDGVTPLHFACSNGHTEIVRFLVEEGKCAVDVRDNNGDTPLHKACRWGQTETVRFLVEEGKCAVDVTDNRGRIPLDIAVEWNNTEIVDYLKSLPQSPPQSATPLTKEDIDALKVLLPDKVFPESTLERVQELLTERGLTELATNLRAKLDEGVQCYTLCSLSWETHPFCGV